MDETTTRRKKIDPKLQEVGWERVPESEILTEQRAYLIAPGKVERIKHSHPKKADYVLEYRGHKLAVIEAKSDEKEVSEGVEQAKQYAEMLQIRYTYSCNGDEIWFVDMGVKDEQGRYTIGSSEHEVERFPSPQELWQMTYPDENPWRDRFNLCAFNRGGERTLWYYQEIAANNVLTAIANGKRRILLTMATGTGKTYTAFQICWKLCQTRWNLHGSNTKPHILFISDRNTLADQAILDFGQFPDDAMARITPDVIREKERKVPTERTIYFTIFQTFMGSEEDGGVPYFMQYPADFFDLIIIDECHRGGANDESEWRRLMDYFEPACQLGMTATPRRKENANTYKYFGEPVYSYSLKQGIDDGYLVPFRVQIASSNIDTYQYDEEDVVTAGEVDEEKTYTEKDFANGSIKIKDRDEHRVIELLEHIDPDEKTIVFCNSQPDAMTVRDLINKHKRRPDSNYCERVTSDDKEEGERILRQFKDNEKLRPTILTTSHKLSTGVDARNVRNIVLMRPINNMVEFKQIIGRGTRLFEGKYYFTIYDFVGASKNFSDPEWDGEPYCPECGNYPCTCKKGTGGGSEPEPPQPPQPCPICGHLPCTCEHPQRRTVVVRLSEVRKLELHTEWEERFQYGDELITLEEFIQALYGRIPTFFEGESDLRKQWEHPEKRAALLEHLAEEGFAEEKLNQLRTVLKMERCDLFDVLTYIAYDKQPLSREERAELLRKEYFDRIEKNLQQFDSFILEYYVRNGSRELGNDKLTTFVNLKYHSMEDAKAELNMTPKQIREHYLVLQHQLYSVTPVVSLHLHGKTINVSPMPCSKKRT